MQPGMSPLAPINLELYKKPSGIPITGADISAPGVFPAQIKSHQHISFSGVIACEPDIADLDIVGFQATYADVEGAKCKE
jgi:hypothetical protein